MGVESLWLLDVLGKLRVCLTCWLTAKRQEFVGTRESEGCSLRGGHSSTRVMPAFGVQSKGAADKSVFEAMTMFLQGLGCHAKILNHDEPATVESLESLRDLEATSPS